VVIRAGGPPSGPLPVVAVRPLRTRLRTPFCSGFQSGSTAMALSLGFLPFGPRPRARADCIGDIFVYCALAGARRRIGRFPVRSAFTSGRFVLGGPVPLQRVLPCVFLVPQPPSSVPVIPRSVRPPCCPPREANSQQSGTTRGLGGARAAGVCGVRRAVPGGVEFARAPPVPAPIALARYDRTGGQGPWSVVGLGPVPGGVGAQAGV
jgi:hypothetical protein